MEIKTSVIKPHDVILVSGSHIPNSDEYVKVLKELFPHNKVVVIQQAINIDILKRGGGPVAADTLNTLEPLSDGFVARDA